MFKKWFSVVCCLLFLGLAGCSADMTNSAPPENSNSESGKTPNASTVSYVNNTPSQPAGSTTMLGKQKLNVAWIHFNAAFSSAQRAKDGFDAFIKEKGLQWDISLFDSKGSGQTFASNMEDAVRRKVDVIIVAMADLRAAKAALEEANKAGIPVYAVDSGWTPGIVVDVTSNNYAMSSKISSYLVDRLGGEGKIIAFKMAEHHGVRKRGEILDVIVKENPGIQVLEEHNIDPTNFYQDTIQSMEDYLQRYGKEIKAVWAGWDEPAMAASAAIQQAGLSRNDIFVTGIDGHPPAVEEIKNGSPLVATVAQGFEIMGAKIGEFIQAIIIDGKKPEEVITSTTIYVDTPLVTEKNLPKEGIPVYKTPDFYSNN